MAKKDYAKSYRPGLYFYTYEEWKYAAWCINNKILISMRYAKPNNFFIDVSIKGKINRDPKERYYRGKEAQQKIYEYYKYYYDKYNK